MKLDATLDKIRKVLTARDESLAVAESVTSGHLQAALSLAEEATYFYQGGITAYNLGQKTRHLNVDPIAAENTNCVSEKIAAVMAHNACKLFASDWSIAVTGYAAPVPEWEVENPLFAYYAFAYRGRIVTAAKVECRNLGIPMVQEFYTAHILQAFAEAVQDAPRVSTDA